MVWDLRNVDKNKIAVADEKNTITFEQALCEAGKIRNIINDRCVILMLCENSVGSFLGYFTFTDMECVVIVLESSIKKTYCLQMIEKYRPQYIWAQAFWKEELGLDSVFGQYDYYLLKTVYEPYGLREEVGGVILSTSGSTGDVKCVQLGYRGIKEHANALAEEIGFTRNDSAITTMPMAFVYTLSFVNFHIMQGATIIMTNRSVLEKSFWDLFYKYRPTCISGLNLHYEMLDKINFFEKDCKFIKIFTQGGDVFSAKMREKVKYYCQQYKKHCFILYGQTETGGTCGSLLLEDDRGRNCIGKAIRSGRFKLKDVDGSGKGELVYCGKCAMLGYVTDVRSLKGVTEKEGMVETGDVVSCDSDGFYFILGRKKRIVKLCGRRVNLDDIENYVRKRLEKECACIGGGEEKVWVIIAAGKEEVEEEWIRKKIKEFLGLSHILINFKYVDLLTRNETGKILYAKLESLVDEQSI